MAQLFGVGVSAISKHLKNIFDELELEKEVVVSKMEITTQHGAMSDKYQTHNVDFNIPENIEIFSDGERFGYYRICCYNYLYIMKYKYTPEFIDELESNEIFVFGSNLAGMHGGGAARFAYKRFGAVWGQGVGLQGQSYAIPTIYILGYTNRMRYCRIQGRRNGSFVSSGIGGGKYCFARGFCCLAELVNKHLIV